MARKTKEESERTYYQLLDAAIDEFTERGVAQTTLLQIATRAGLTRGAIYWHFKNKDELIMDLWQHQAGDYHKLFCDELNNLTPEHGAQRFRELVEMMISQLGQDKRMKQTLHIISNVMEYADKDSDINLYMHARSNDIHQALMTAIHMLQKHGTIKLQIAPELMASGAFAYFIGLAEIGLMHGCGKVNSIDLASSYPHMARLILDGWFAGS